MPGEGHRLFHRHVAPTGFRHEPGAQGMRAVVALQIGQLGPPLHHEPQRLGGQGLGHRLTAETSSQAVKASAARPRRGLSASG